MRSWRFWIVPSWFRRRWIWYAILVSVLVPVQALFMYLHRIVQQSSPVNVLGQSTTGINTDGWGVVVLMFMLIITELMGVFDMAAAKPANFEQRPLSTARRWLTVQLDGLARLPLQIILLAPVVLSAYAGGVLVPMTFFTAGLLFSVVIMARSLLVAYEVGESVYALMPFWTSAITRIVLHVSLLILFVVPMAVTVSYLKDEVSTAPAGVAVLVANLAAIGLLAFVARYRRAAMHEPSMV